MNKDAARFFSYLAIVGGLALALVTVIAPSATAFRDAVFAVGLGILAVWLQNEAKA